MEEIIALLSHDLHPRSHESRQLIDECFSPEPEPREILLVVLRATRNHRFSMHPTFLPKTWLKEVRFKNEKEKLQVHVYTPTHARYLLALQHAYKHARNVVTCSTHIHTRTHTYLFSSTHTDTQTHVQYLLSSTHTDTHMCTHGTYLLSSTHQPQYGSCAPRHSPQLWNRLHCCTFTMETWQIEKLRIFRILDSLLILYSQKILH